MVQALSVEQTSFLNSVNCKIIEINIASNGSHPLVTDTIIIIAHVHIHTIHFKQFAHVQ